MKYFFFFLSFFVSTNGFSQEESKTIRFEIYEMKNQPFSGVSILEKGTENGTSTDLEGKAELNIKNINNKVEISFLGPYLAIDIIEEADLIKVFLHKKPKVEYYKNGKRIKKKRLKH